MTAPKQAEAVMTSIPKFVSSIPEKPVAECNPYSHHLVKLARIVLQNAPAYSSPNGSGHPCLVG